MADAPKQPTAKPRPQGKQRPQSSPKPASGGLLGVLDSIANALFGPPAAKAPKGTGVRVHATAATATGLEPPGPALNWREPPLSPHLQIYRMPFAAGVLSILHRLTGIALALGTLLLVGLFVAAAVGADAYATAQSIAGSWPGQLLLLGWTWALFYHMAAGLRHLALDFGYGFDLPTAEKTAWAVVLTSAGATMLVWILAYLRLLSMD